ncbi:XRE family transcriptional regulator [Anoxybacillus sp. ST4]|nr:XRE family transcriptional regulator [Anoxybacillus sp. ST4]
MKKYKLKSRIGEAIEKSGLRNDYIRKHVDVQQKQLWNWKNGVSFPTLEKAFILAKILRCKVDDLAELIEVEEDDEEK